MSTEEYSVLLLYHVHLATGCNWTSFSILWTYRSPIYYVQDTKSKLHDDFTTYMFKIISSSLNIKYLIPFMFFVLYYTNLHLTPGVAIQNQWHNLSHNSKRLTNTALKTIPCYSAETQYSQYIWTHQIFSQAAVRQLSVCTNLPLYQLTLIH